MSTRSARECVITFLDAFYAGDIAGAEACCHEGVSSLTHAPVDLFPNLGLKQGRAWLGEIIRIQQQRFTQRRHVLRFIAADGLRVATICDLTFAKRRDGRVVQVSAGEFFTLSGGRIFEHRAYFDSFDLVQQLIGRDLTGEFALELAAAMHA